MPVWAGVSHRRRGNLGENLSMALDTMRSHRLRSALTLLGITVAITTLIAVVAVLMGLDRNIQETIQGYGVNTAFFSHLPVGPRFGRLSKQERLRKPLSYDDFLAVKEACTACVNITVSIFTQGSLAMNPGGLPSGIPDSVRYRDQEIAGLDFRGATSEFFSVYANAVLNMGRPFTEAEDIHRVAVAVIGADVAKGLFGAEDPLGKDIVADGETLRVIGVFEKPRGAMGAPGQDEDRRLVMPYWTFRKIYPLEKTHGIRIEAAPNQLPRAIDQASIALRRSRRVPYDQPDDFNFATSDSLIRDFHNIVGAVALVVTVIASVGLIIGGVGVMNIMLVSVTERTHEIGVRMAMGARRRDIIWQFLTEAMMMACFGGMFGVLFGYLISAGVRLLSASLPTYVPLWTVILGVAVATTVGLFFGMYPAVKAAQLDPVVALHYE